MLFVGFMLVDSACHFFHLIQYKTSCYLTLRWGVAVWFEGLEGLEGVRDRITCTPQLKQLLWNCSLSYGKLIVRRDHEGSATGALVPGAILVCILHM